MANSVRSVDPKVHLVPLEEWLTDNDFLIGVSKSDFWNPTKKPDPCEHDKYYFVSDDKLISIVYEVRFADFFEDSKEKLEGIFYAQRDYAKEDLLFEKKRKELEKNLAAHPYSKKTREGIKSLEKTKTLLRKAVRKGKADLQNQQVSYNHSLYKSDLVELASKYVVMDVETNGLRRATDDLLSFSIYDPLIGVSYNRLLPLHMQPLVLTSWIHGITTEDLKNVTDLSQPELDSLIAFFGLNNRTILCYSGGKGTFDSGFFKNYCKRQGLRGYERFSYENIKALLPKASFGYEGKLSKDNMCNLLGIDGVSEIHSSQNDCVLEWRLFEKLKTNNYFFIDGTLYNYSPKYVAPITYLIKYPKLREVSKIQLPNVIGKLLPVFSYRLPKGILKLVKKYPTNITGIALENGINSCLKVEKQNNYAFLIRNKRNLERIGSLQSNLEEIPIYKDEDSGTLVALDNKDADYVDDINRTTLLLMKRFSPLFDFIKNEIFKGEVIKGQEMVISPDGKVLAICDLSSETTILEIKTFGIKKDDDNVIRTGLPLQLYFEANNRKIFTLSIDFKRHLNSRGEVIIDDIDVNIYKVDLEIVDENKLTDERG